jgi:hypothetical protein
MKKAGFRLGNGRAIAFSSEVDAGSRQESASKQHKSFGSDPIRTEKAKNQPENVKT